MFRTLAERRINLLAVSTSEIKVSALVAEDELELAVRVLHTAFGLDEEKAGMSAGHKRLRQLMHRGTEFLGADWAIMGGAMSWISERHLVSAISNAGGFGVIACGAMSPELLDTEIARDRQARRPGRSASTSSPCIPQLSAS